MTSSLPAALTSRYAIERELGRGGMGAVYLARDRTLDRDVALKVLPPEVASSASLRERFLRETRVAASFSHPNIVPVYAVEQHDDVLAYAMGFIDGESLGARVARMGPLPIRDVVSLLQDVCYALAYAHGRGIVHRDLKPDNIMIERATGRALLMDFGVARTITSTPAHGSTALTRVGEIVGTPEYMSPEQASGDTVDGRSDLYALGLVAYFALSGQPAFTGVSTQQVIVKQLTEAPPPISQVRADTPPPLAALIEQCLCKEPGDRFATAGAVLEALDRAQVMGPQIPLPVRLFVQDVQMVALIVFFAMLLIITQASAALDDALRDGFIKNGDRFIPLVILFAIIVARSLHVISEGRRLKLAGFEAEDVRKAVRAMHAERDEVRQQNAANPVIRARRRRTVQRAIGMLAAGVLLLALAWSSRRQLGPTSFYTPPHGLLELFAGLALLGAAFVSLMLNPMSVPLAERLQRVLWLGIPGRVLLRVSMGRSEPLAPASSGARGTPAPVAPVSNAPLPVARLDALEKRVAALESRNR
ncbi:MAG: serine/threonine protein kinase [Gemmatimonadaceae bacterium]|nr:serine/threonine protein kinase [Gemmatimonadaceae bacterium]